MLVFIFFLCFQPLQVVREALQSSVDKLHQSSREVEETLSTREAELKVADQTSEMLRKELEKTKAELKKTEEKFLYVSRIITR